MKSWARAFLIRRGEVVFYNHQAENQWRGILWSIFGPAMLIGIVLLAVWIPARPVLRDPKNDPFPHAYGLAWLVVIVLNVIAQAITFQPTVWNEMVFSIYYVLLFFITAVILHCYESMKRQ